MRLAGARGHGPRNSSNIIASDVLAKLSKGHPLALVGRVILTRKERVHHFASADLKKFDLLKYLRWQRHVERSSRDLDLTEDLFYDFV